MVQYTEVSLLLYTVMTRQWFAPCKLISFCSCQPDLILLLYAALHCMKLEERWQRKIPHNERGHWSSWPAPSGLPGLKMSATKTDRAQILHCGLSHTRVTSYTAHTEELNYQAPSCQSIIYFCQAIYPGNLYFYLAKQPEGKEWHSEENFTNIYTSCLDDMSMSTSDLWG